jgi:hypothetical protein
LRYAKVTRWRLCEGTVTGHKPTLTDGWNLTVLEATLDSKITEAITALVGAARLGVAPGARVAPEITPGIYKVVFPTKPEEPPQIPGPVKFP